MGEAILWYAVPIFPISILLYFIYHEAESKLKDYFVPLLLILAFIGLGFAKVEVEGLQKFLALLSSVFFTYLLYREENPFNWLFYYYGAFSALSWFEPQKMFPYLVVGAFPIVALNLVLVRLKENVKVANFDDLAALSGFSGLVYLVSSVSVIMFLLVAPLHNFFFLYKVFAKLNFFTAVSFLLLWIAWLLSGVPRFIKMFIGFPKPGEYKSLERPEVFLITALVLISILFVVF